MYDKFEMIIMSIIYYMEKSAPYLISAVVLNIMYYLIKGAF
jgi:hypothetical protein